MNISQLSVSFTRPANNTPYTAGDAVGSDSGSIQTFVQAGTSRPIISGEVVGARIFFDHNDTTNGTFRLFLFDTDDNLSAIADNAASNFSVAAMEDCIGAIDFTLDASGLSSSSVVGTMDDISSIHLPFRTKDGIYGRLCAIGAYIPKFAGTIRINLVVREDY